MDSLSNKKASPASKKEFLFSVLLLFLFWFIISFPSDIYSPVWEKNLLQHIVLGLILSVLITRLMKKPLFTADQIVSYNWRNLLRFLSYLVYLFYEIIIAGLDVARRVLRRKLLIQPYLVTLDTPLRDEVHLVINANSITLTPGTITVDVEQGTSGSRFLVHCISEEAARRISQSGGFVKEILYFCGQDKYDG
jgi:multicomponent Na+:H+ antiporter subunit E